MAKNRLQLLDGLVNGTLTNEEKAVAKQFSYIMKAAEEQTKAPVIEKKPKGGNK